jgi:hypothetical protein
LKIYFLDPRLKVLLVMLPALKRHFTVCAYCAAGSSSVRPCYYSMALIHTLSLPPITMIDTGLTSMLRL